MIDTTRTLLELWQPGMDVPSLDRVALASGQFPNVSARRLHNIVSECFAPRYLNRERVPAALLKPLREALSGQAFAQLLFLYTCRANLLLADFVREVYWAAVDV